MRYAEDVYKGYAIDAIGIYNGSVALADKPHFWYLGLNEKQLREYP
jgi:hypothetical protein